MQILIRGFHRQISLFVGPQPLTNAALVEATQCAVKRHLVLSSGFSRAQTTSVAIAGVSECRLNTQRRRAGNVAKRVTWSLPRYGVEP